MKLFALIALTLSLLLIGVNAHVSFSVSSGVIGGSSIVGQFQVGHGCFVNGVGQDTLSLTITLPASLGSIAIADVPNFTSLTATIPNGGGTLIQWTAIPPYTLIGNVTRFQLFPVSFKIQSSVANNTMIYMPSLQSCTNNASVYWNSTQANHHDEGSSVNPAPSLRALLPNTNPGNPSVIIMNSDNGWKSSDTLSVIAIVLSGVVMLIQLTQCFTTKKSVPGNHHNARNNQNYIVANKKSPSNMDLAAKQNNNNNNNTQRAKDVRGEAPATETANNSESNTPVHENETERTEAVEFHV